MIKTEKGATTIKGSAPELLADFAVITKALRTSLIEGGVEKYDAEAKLEAAFKSGLKAEEDIADNLAKLKILKEFLSNLADLLNVDDDEEKKEDN